MGDSELLADLARVKAIFQLRAIAAVIGIPSDAPGNIPDNPLHQQSNAHGISGEVISHNHATNATNG